MPVLVYPVASGGAGQGASDHLSDLIKAQRSSLPCHWSWFLIPRPGQRASSGNGLIGFAAKAEDPEEDRTSPKQTAVGNRTSHLC
ncbi:hypothetical protein Syn8016DRAFT_2670 [Synechococcus sp. WH 8016]|nr:hypothetical protein Syn8016DRAFT_2670 [Synechococcus sp. WH 8016]